MDEDYNDDGMYINLDADDLQIEADAAFREEDVRSIMYIYTPPLE